MARSDLSREPPPSASMTLPAILAVHAGIAIVTLDISLTSTALPTIATGIGAAPSSVIWIVNAYYLAVIAALLPLAALGEIYGHRRIFLGGLFVFACGSLASSLSGSLIGLAVARGLVGAGTAAVSATTPALIRTLYPPEKLGRGLGQYALVVGVAFSIGPTFASAVLSVGSWPFLFLTNVPFALMALFLAGRGLPDTERNVRPFDGLSAIFCAGMFAAILFAIAGVAHSMEWRFIAVATLVGAGCLLVLRYREAGATAPIFAVDLFKVPVFALSSLTSICAFTIQGLVFVVLPYFFHFSLGFTQVQAGFLITPWPITLAAMTFIAAPLGDRIEPGLIAGIGLATVAIGLASLAVLPSQPATFEIEWRLVLCGVGFGLFQTPNMKAIMSSAPRSRSGSAGGILAASRLFGQSLGAAVVAVCLSAYAFAGITVAIWTGAAVALFGSAVSFARLFAPFRGSPQS